VGKKKLIRFKENLTFTNLLQPSFQELYEGFHLRGKWRAEYFNNTNPIILELGCGKGEYTISLARMYPYQNFIGIDIKGARLWKGCKIATHEKLKNVAFVRSKIELIELLFDENEIDEIWLTFPDPQIRKSDEKKRLTSQVFLNRYEKITKDGGLIHLKTDNQLLATYTLEILKKTNYELILSSFDIYRSEYEGPAKMFRTFYEYKFLERGIPIKYIQFKIRKKDAE
jgi:tRNA (guanine-N7-)-methyltransferase